jgi:methyltransferase (TIGR00027 family)
MGSGDSLIFALQVAPPEETLMVPEQASISMVRTAIRRAAHQLLDLPRILEDPVAVGLVPEATERAILAAAEEHRAPLSTLLRALFAFRNRFTEDRLTEAVARGVRQYVVVGAGLDTFAWRQPPFAHHMQIFYVDHPISLDWTMARFRQCGLRMPANLSFVAADLETRELAVRLEESGFEREAGTFFSVLGVTQYIKRDAIEALARFAASMQVQSEIVFSFVFPNDDLEGQELEAALHGVASTKAMGEPWVTRLRVSELFDLLTRLGFGEVFHLTPKRAQQRYFAGRDDMLKAPQLEQLIAAVV